MGFAKIRDDDADLRPLFGELSNAEHDRLVARLRSLEQELGDLAGEVSTHLDLAVKPYPMELHWEASGDAELSLGMGTFPVELYLTARPTLAGLAGRGRGTRVSMSIAS